MAEPLVDVAHALDELRDLVAAEDRVHGGRHAFRLRGAALLGDLGDPAGDERRVGTGLERGAVAGKSLVAVVDLELGDGCSGVLVGAVLALEELVDGRLSVLVVEQ